MAYTQEQANQLYSALPEQDRAVVDRAGGPTVAWFTGAVNAGQPDANRIAGGGQNEEGGQGTALGGGEPTKNWLGKRKPTPAELIRYYQETGKSEDFARFSPAQVADWINRKWDINGGHFTNDFGDIVEKPTESGPNSHAAGYATGEKDAGRVGGGGGGGAPPPAQTGSNPLLNNLLRAWSGGQGMFGLGPEANAGGQNVATQLPGGALWWGTQKPGSQPEPPAASLQPPAGTPGGQAAPQLLNVAHAAGLGGKSVQGVSATPGNPLVNSPPTFAAPNFTGFDLDRFVGGRTYNPLMQKLAGFPQFQ